MTPQEYLEEVRKRLDNATPRPWSEWIGRDPDGTDRYGISPDGDLETDVATFPWTPQGAEDMEFFANAPEDIDKLYKFAREVVASVQRWGQHNAYAHGPGEAEAAYADGYQNATDSIVDSLNDTIEEFLT